MKSIMRSLIITTFACILSSCIKNVEPHKVTFGERGNAGALKTECQSINAEGSLLELLQEIKDSHSEILYLIGLPDPTHEELKIKELAQTIKDAGEKLSSLVDSEWTMSKWKQNIVWTIDESNFKPTLGTYLPHGFSIQDASIHSVYWMGEKNDFLKSKIVISRKGNRLEITLQNLMSSLDVCQLQESLIVILEVNFRNIKWQKKQYFNLSTNNEFERSL